jgi:hypothetical protein
MVLPGACEEESNIMSQDYETTRYLIELLFEEHGLNKPGYLELLREDAYRLADLIARGHTVDQALDTVEAPSLRRHLCSFLYPIRLRMLVIASARAGILGEEEAQELHKYLKDS